MTKNIEYIPTIKFQECSFVYVFGKKTFSEARRYIPAVDLFHVFELGFDIINNSLMQSIENSKNKCG